MYIIAGLGNPTLKYYKTRHNLGFDAIDCLAERHDIKVNNMKFKSLYGQGTINGEKVILMKPQTFMNLSGEAVSEAVNFYKIDAATGLIVLYDDISLLPGKIRLRKKGSAGGHNGIKNIIAHLSGENFLRIKIGAGLKPDYMDMADYVLSGFNSTDRAAVDDALIRVCEAVETTILDDFDKAMNKYN